MGKEGSERAAAVRSSHCTRKTSIEQWSFAEEKEEEEEGERERGEKGGGDNGAQSKTPLLIHNRSHSPKHTVHQRGRQGESGTHTHTHTPSLTLTHTQRG